MGQELLSEIEIEAFARTNRGNGGMGVKSITVTRGDKMGSKTVAKQAVRKGAPVRKATFKTVKRGVYAPVNKRAVRFTRAIGGRVNAKITKAELLQVSNNGAEVCVYTSDGTLKPMVF